MSSKTHIKLFNESDLQICDQSKLTLDNPRLQKTRIFYLALLLILPLAGTILGIFFASRYGLGSFEIGIMLLMYVASIIGVDVGFHRYLTHQSFKTKTPLRIFLIILGSMAGEGSPLYWVSNHRFHHAFSDEPKDPHSPNSSGKTFLDQLKGLLHAHVGWMGGPETANPFYFSKDLLHDPVFRKLNQQYLLWVILGLVLPAILGGLILWSPFGIILGFLWGGLIRIFLLSHFSWCINSICHRFGSQPFETKDKSKNNFWLVIPTFGEAWHNNHHAFQDSYKFGHRWWQLDPGAWFIDMCKKLGLVWDAKVPSSQMIKYKRK